MRCPICGASAIEVVEVNYPFFRQSDFITVKPSGAIERCERCQALFQYVDTREEMVMDEQFEDESYAFSHQTSQTVPAEEYGRPVTRCFLQAELLRRVVTRDDPWILDIGCYDGELLVELEKRFPEAQLHGFDPTEHLRRFFPTAPRYRFWSPDLDTVEGRFDLICVSHTLMYVKDVPHLMANITRLLKPEGVMFLQMPDIAANPMYILMGDQYSYYTPTILRNTLQRFGFSFQPVSNPWFPREILGIARQAASGPCEDTEDRQIHRCVAALQEKVARLRCIPDGSPVGVLGTTGNAAFVDSILGEKVIRVFDENPHRLGTIFRNKRVVHPSALEDSDLLVIPYGVSGRRIQERFALQYRGRSIVV